MIITTNIMASPHTITVVEHSEARTRGVALALSGPDLAPGQARLRIRRCGYKKPFLQAGGWGVIESWLDIPALLDDAGKVLKLPLAPASAYHLEENSNYVITIEAPGLPAIERPVRWSLTSKRRAPLPAAPQPEAIPAARVAVLSTVAEAAAPPSSRDIESAWQAARQLDSQEAYASFLATYPDSSHVAEARQALEAIDRQAQLARQVRIEELAWLAAKQMGSKKKFTEYLLTYPEGRFSEQARRELAAFLPERLLVTTRWSSSGRAAPHGADMCVFLLETSGLVRDDRSMISSWVTDEASGMVLSDSRCGSVRNAGVHLDPARHAGSESVAIELSLVPEEVDVIAITLSVDIRVSGDVGLEAVPAELEVIDAGSEQSLVTIVTEETSFGNKARVVLEIRRRGDDWVIRHANEAIKDGIQGICQRFGIAAG